MAPRRRLPAYYFKYCSTFNSTSEGNIGPVADALMTALETDFTTAAPLSRKGRTVYRGHLFVQTPFSANRECRTTR